MTQTGNLAEQFQEVLPAEAILAGPELDRFSVDGLAPRVVVSPGSVEEVAAVLQRCHHEGLAVVPWGGGTRMGLGNPPARYDVALSLASLDRRVDHQPEDLTATVQAGMTLDHLNEALAKSGQYLPLDPPLPGQATVGGTLASAASGPLRHRYGTARDMTIGIRVVHADGAVTRAGGKVVKNVTGYDMAKLYLGSLGTLAVIVEATFKVLPRPKALGALIAFLPSAEAAAESALALFDSPLDLLALDLASRSALQRIPGVPRPPSEEAVALVAIAGGQAAAVDRVLEQTTDIAQRHGARELDRQWNADVVSLRRALADLGRGREAASVLETRVSVLPTKVADVMVALPHLGQRHGLEEETAAHFAHGVVHTAWRPQPGHDVAAHDARALVDDLRGFVAGLEGHVVVEGCDPEAKRQLDVWGETGSAWPVMRGIKRAYDPRGILSPGRFVGGL